MMVNLQFTVLRNKCFKYFFCRDEDRYFDTEYPSVTTAFFVVIHCHLMYYYALPFLIAINLVFVLVG
jgi:hypothetical protein